jgi:hypothetical protein
LRHLISFMSLVKRLAASAIRQRLPGTVSRIP